MKKIIFSLIASGLITNLSYGQATLERSYKTKSFDYDNHNSFKTKSGINYFTLDDNTNTLQFFDSNHDLYKTVIIPVSSGYTLDYISTINDVLFNSDDLIEFIAFSGSNTNSNIRKATLINENGVVLQEFGNRQKALVIKGIGGTYKLITYLEPFGQIPATTDHAFDVYSLPGTTLNSVTNKKIGENLLVGYPNPAANKIAITNPLKNGEKDVLEVFDINGKKVLQINISGGNPEINLDITDLTRGIYIYRINGNTNKFIKE
jgi:hypothetical protein